MSTAAPIPFTDGQASGIEELAGASPAVINVIHDAGDSMRTRPGLSAWASFPAVIPDASPVIGIWIFGAYVVYCTADRKLWALVSPGLVIALSDATAATKLDGTGRPCAVVTRTRIVIIGGGVPQKWEGVGLSARLGGSPPSGVGIAALAQRLVIADSNNTGLIFWSDPGELGGGHEVWSGDMASAEAEGSPDPIVAMGSTVNELYTLGTQTLQVFIPDPDAVFVPGTTIEIGSLSPGSLIKQDGAFCFMDDKRRIVNTDGRTFTDLGGVAMAQTLWRFSTVSDCWSFRARFDAVDLVGFVFPTEGRACVYNSAVQKWAEWRSIDSAGRWQPWAGQCHCVWPAQGIHLIGMADGSIMLLDPTVFTEAGQALKALVRTGFGDRGSGNRKVCERLQLSMRRGETAVTTAPQASVRWRDDLGAFGRAVPISLGAAGDTDAQVQKWTLGVYNARQWELSMSDPSQFVLTSAEELYTVLEA